MPLSWFDAHLDLAYLAVAGRDMLPTPERVSAPEFKPGLKLVSLVDRNMRRCSGAISRNREANGGGSPGTGFSFTNADMNSPLLDPLRAARPTLEKVGLVSATACDQLGTLIPMDDPSVADMWKSFPPPARAAVVPVARGW